MKNITIRPILPEEIDKVAEFISKGYCDDIYFHWLVDNAKDRFEIVKGYYVTYLGAKGSVSHVAESSFGEIVGTTVWLPHDLDLSVSDEVYKGAGIYADNFKKVSAKSYCSCPPMEPFYELVAVVTAKEMQGKGIGAALLKYHLDILDELGISTYLEASTPYYGGGVYGKFGYQQAGELMVFTDTAVLYPLWRPAKKKPKVINFGGYNWQVLEIRDEAMLLLSEKIIELGKYHAVFENITWGKSDIRKYLNDSFYNRFNPNEKSQILEKEIINNCNPWYYSDGGDATKDKIFLLSVEEVVKYFGDSGQLKNPSSRFFIDDAFNDDRKAMLSDNSPSRWLLRTPGNSQNFVSAVTIDGRVLVTGDFVNRLSSELFNVGIRPAMWVSKGEISQ